MKALKSITEPAERQQNKMTNGQLFHYHQEIMSMRGSIIEVFLRSKIKEFYNQNGIRLRSLTEKMQALSDEYFKQEDGKILYDEEKKPIPLEGKTIEDYQKTFGELMAQEIHILL